MPGESGMPPHGSRMSSNGHDPSRTASFTAPVVAAVHREHRAQRGAGQLARHRGHRRDHRRQRGDTVVAGLRGQRRGIVDVEDVADLDTLDVRARIAQRQGEPRHDATAGHQHLRPPPADLGGGGTTAPHVVGVFGERRDARQLRHAIRGVFAQCSEQIPEDHEHRPHVRMRMIHADDHRRFRYRVNCAQSMGRCGKRRAAFVEDPPERLVHGLTGADLVVHPLPRCDVDLLQREVLGIARFALNEGRFQGAVAIHHRQPRRGESIAIHDRRQRESNGHPRSGAFAMADVAALVERNRQLPSGARNADVVSRKLAEREAEVRYIGQSHEFDPTEQLSHRGTQIEFDI